MIVQRFLIIRFSSIGDIVLTTPVVRCIRNQIENSEIHYLTKKSFEPVLRNNPHIHKMHFIDDENCFAGLSKIDFHAVIDLHHNLRSWKVKRRIHAPAFSFHKLNIEKWLHVNFKWKTLPNIHIVDRYLQTVKKFGVKNDFEGLDFFSDPNAENVFTNHSINKKEKYIAITVGAGHGTKQLPASKLIEIIQKLKYPVVLLGGKEDEAKANEIVLNTHTSAINLCGKISLHQSAAIVKHAYKVLSHDTGLMHIASSFKKDIVAVWGNTVPAFGMSPYMSGINSVNKEVNVGCRPCSKIGYEKCPRKHFKCMLEQNIDEISSSLNS